MTPTRCLLVPLAGAILLSTALPRRADACGCVAPPDPATPVVQAGERIVFAQSEGKVTAFIQLQYQGEASEFGWLLPLPSIPEFRLGTEAMFAALEANTAPQFLTNNTGGFCGGGGVGCSEDVSLSAPVPDAVPMEPSVAVVQASAGPYDYAVLDASDRSAMLEWLSDNRYFIPTGTEDVVGPYIHEGAYFLALKLRAGQTSGDLQPVVIEYESDLPMIPIILTQVAATPDMGILVYVLGESRAVPRNYEHVVVNEEHIAWFDDASNYFDVVSRAIDESERHQAFVTEFAGSTEAMRGVIVTGDLGDVDRLAELEDARAFVDYLTARPYPPSLLRPILDRAFAPSNTDGLADDAYLQELRWFLGRNPPADFDPRALADEIWERVVEPLEEANALFDTHPYLTRMLTILSPEEMTADPVFSFNRDLGDVSRLHTANLETLCDERDRPLEFTLSDGRRYRMDATTEWAQRDRSDRPSAIRVEVLREEGDAEVKTDNFGVLEALTDEGEGGCRHTGRSSRSGLYSFLLIFVVVGLGRRMISR